MSARLPTSTDPTGVPNYVEVKGFSFVGGAREEQRGLSMETMPTHDEIRQFARRLAELTGYIVTAEHMPSRIVLLSKDEQSRKGRIIDFSKVGKEYSSSAPEMVQ